MSKFDLAKSRVDFLSLILFSALSARIVKWTRKGIRDEQSFWNVSKKN